MATKKQHDSNSTPQDDISRQVEELLKEVNSPMPPKQNELQETVQSLLNGCDRIFVLAGNDEGFHCLLHGDERDLMLMLARTIETDEGNAGRLLRFLAKTFVMCRMGTIE